MSKQTSDLTQDYTGRLQAMLDSINALLAAAHGEGIYFNLYLDPFEGGSGSTYCGYVDGRRCEAASVTRVRVIDILDDEEYEDEEYEDEC